MSRISQKAPNLFRLFASANYYRADAWMAANGAASARIKDTIYYTPFTVSKTTAFDRIAANIETGQANTSVRLGLYADNGNGKPGAKIWGSDQQATTASPTVLDLTISQTLTPGIYWLAYVSQGGTTQPSPTTIATAGYSPLISEGTSAGAGTVTPGYNEAGVANAALPATATPATVATLHPKLMLRAL